MRRVIHRLHFDNLDDRWSSLSRPGQELLEELEAVGLDVLLLDVDLAAELDSDELEESEPLEDEEDELPVSEADCLPRLSVR